MGKKDNKDKKKKDQKKKHQEDPDIDMNGIDYEDDGNEIEKLSNTFYENELPSLQAELVKMEEWVRVKGLKVVVIFEGRDAAGKGGAIKRITECLNPRVTRVAALPVPTEREKTQWYFQRYVAHLPAAGEIVIFDRSWYNRAGVEHVMGFCSEEEYWDFLRSCPIFERDADPLRDHPDQILVLREFQGAGKTVPGQDQ